MAIRKTSILIATALLILPSLAIGATTEKEPSLSRPAASSKIAMAEEYQKLRIEREKLIIERAHLNIHCMESKEADKKDCVEKKRALREKLEKASDKIHDMREKYRAGRRTAKTSQNNN